MDSVGTTHMNGLSISDNYLWVFYAYSSTGALWLSRVNTSDNLVVSSPVPTYYPSYRTSDPVGIAAKASAFDQLCYMWPGWWMPCNRMYLYLIWKDRYTSDIYTSVFQSASPYRFTRSQPSFYQAKTYTGVAWSRGNLPDDNLQGIFTDATQGTSHQFHGYGKY